MSMIALTGHNGHGSPPDELGESRSEAHQCPSEPRAPTSGVMHKVPVTIHSLGQDITEIILEYLGASKFLWEQKRRAFQPSSPKPPGIASHSTISVSFRLAVERDLFRYLTFKSTQLDQVPEMNLSRIRSVRFLEYRMYPPFGDPNALKRELHQMLWFLKTLDSEDGPMITLSLVRVARGVSSGDQQQSFLEPHGAESLSELPQICRPFSLNFKFGPDEMEGQYILSFSF